MEVVQIVDLRRECFQEYKEAHTNVPVESALEAVGLGKIRVLYWQGQDKSNPIRLVMTAEWRPTREENFEEAMERYIALPGVKEWEEWMDTLKVPLPGTTTPNWQRCSQIYCTPGS